jgi:carbonic anhydrase
MTEPLIAQNLSWAARRMRDDPDLFRRRLAQTPRRLWIGCSDNAQSDLETAAFVDEGCLISRNLGNQIAMQDFGFMGTLCYALQTAGVVEVVVCGHYGCACLRSLLHREGQSVSDFWCSPIRRLVREKRSALDAIVGEDAQIQYLCELNVREQVRNLTEHPIVTPLLTSGNLRVHGVVWSPRDGLLRDLGLEFARRGTTGRKEARKRKEGHVLPARAIRTT